MAGPTDMPGTSIVGLPNSIVLYRHNIPTPCSDGGLKTPEQAKETILIRVEQDLITQYHDCFNVIGKFQGEYHITVDPNVPPMIHPPRRVPINFTDDIKSELDDMVKNCIITKLNKDKD